MLIWKRLFAWSWSVILLGTASLNFYLAFTGKPAPYDNFRLLIGLILVVVAGIYIDRQIMRK